MSSEHYPSQALTPVGARLDRGAMGVIGLLMVLFLVPAWLYARFGPALATDGAVELKALAWAAILALAIPLFQIGYHGYLLGGPKIRGNRDDYPALTGVAARIVRAHANMTESLGPFAAVVLCAAALHVSNELSALSACVYVGARLVHAVSYVAGIVVLRSAAYYAGVAATLVVATEVVFR